MKANSKRGRIGEPLVELIEPFYGIQKKHIKMRLTAPLQCNSSLVPRRADEELTSMILYIKIHKPFDCFNKIRYLHIVQLRNHSLRHIVTLILTWHSHRHFLL